MKAGRTHPRLQWYGVKTLLKKIRYFFIYFFSGNGRETTLPFPGEEIRSLVDVGRKEGFLDKQSAQMLENVLELGDTVAREVMVPRTEIIALSSDAGIEEILNLVSRHGHTRMPVYVENIDNIIGVLNVKDLLRFWSHQVDQHNFMSILRKAYFIPETKSIHILLHELKEMKSHMAVVIDEYGGTSGLVTLEDLIEEIVGEIHDEYDADEEEPFTELSSGDVMVDGRAEIDEFETYFDCVIPDGQFETVGGFILFLVKKIPLAGEVIPYENIEMVIEKADERSIKKVRVRRLSGKALPGDERRKPPGGAAGDVTE